MNELPQTCLPPINTSVSPSQRGYLKITPIALTFFNNQNSKNLLKIQFWGSPQANYLQVQTTEAFPIVSNLTKFKLYLIDSKVTPIEVVDSRNHKVIGVAYINWLLYLRSIEDKLLYREDDRDQDQSEPGFFLPFIDEQMEDVLPLFKSSGSMKQKSNQKLGEIKIRWQCKIFDLIESRAATPPQLNSQQNLYNIRVSHPGGKDDRFASICEIDMIQEDNRSSHNLHYDNPKRMSKMTDSNNSMLLGYEPNKGTPQYKEARSSGISRVSKVSKISKDQVIQRFKPDSGLKYNDNNLDAELVRIRMEMSEYIPEQDQKINEKVLKVISFENNNRHVNVKDLTFLDILSQNKDQKNRYRIFPENFSSSLAHFNSSLGIGVNSLLTFSLGFKKNKEGQPKGQITLATIGETKELSIFGSDGLLCGFLKLGVASNKKKLSNLATVIADKIENEGRIQNKDQQTFKANSYQSKEFKSMPLSIDPIRRESPKQQYFKDASQLYYLLLLEEPNEVTDSYSYLAFGRKIEGPTSRKFAIWSQKQISGKSLTISIFNSDQLLIHEQKVLEQIKSSSKNGQNMTCALILKKVLTLSKVSCSLYSGSVDQLVFFIQELTQNILTQMKTTLPQRQNLQYQVMDRLSSQQRQNTEEIMRKMKTEEAVGVPVKERRMTEEREGQSLTGHQLDIQLPLGHEMEMGGQNNDENQNFYLVDLLTRFLQQIQSKSLPENKQIDKSEFVKSFETDNKDSQFQLQVVEMIISIFQEEPGSPVSLDLLRQSIKAFKTYLALYTEQKTTLLKQILAQQGRAAERIRNSAEMAMINEKLLWGKALNKVQKSEIRDKINKFYRISSFAPTEAILLIEDLQNLTAPPSEKAKLRSMDICNLGSLIKDWVQQFLVSLQKEAIKRVKDKVIELNQDNSAMLNIRTTNEIFEFELGLRLSLWESLMLIEEVKSSYICDIDAGQGIISGDSLANWIESVISRHGSQNQSMQESKVSEVIRELQAWGKDHHEHKIENRSVRSRGGSRFQDSQVYKNNDSDIVDIANLLRQREEQQQKRQFTKETPYKDKILQSQKEIKLKQNLFFKKNIQNEEIQQSKPLKETNKKSNVGLFYVQVDELVFFEKTKPQESLLKFTVTLGEDTQKMSTFLYLTVQMGFSEANGQSFQIKTKINKNQVLYMRIFNQTDLMGSAALDWQEYVSWFKGPEEKMKKTLMMHGRKGTILGKVSLALVKTHLSKDAREEEGPERMKLKIVESVPWSNVHFQLKLSQRDASLHIEVGKEYEILLQKPIYSRQLLIQNASKDGSCLVLLQQLYLKKYLKAEYPLIDTMDGTFRGNLKIELAIEGHPLQNTQNIPAVQEKVVITEARQTSKEGEKRQLASDKMRELKNHELMKQINTLYDSLRSRYGEIPRRK